MARRHPSDPVERLAFGVAGDLLRALPEDRRPTGGRFCRRSYDWPRTRGGPVILHPLHDSSAAERVAWMDRVGIDHCLVNPGGYWQMLEFIGHGRAEGAARCNDYLAEQLSGHVDRLHGVAVVDFSDPVGAAKELERARRAATAPFSCTRQRPAPGACHPDIPTGTSCGRRQPASEWWPSIHIGNTAADFSGWADIGWDRPGGGGVTALTRLANTQRIHVAQNLLVSMLYGGVFHRHPELTVILEEMKVGWVPSFVDACTRQSLPSPGSATGPTTSAVATCCDATSR